MASSSCCPIMDVVVIDLCVSDCINVDSMGKTKKGSEGVGAGPGNSSGRKTRAMSAAESVKEDRSSPSTSKTLIPKFSQVVGLGAEESSGSKLEAA